MTGQEENPGDRDAKGCDWMLIGSVLAAGAMLLVGAAVAILPSSGFMAAQQVIYDAMTLMADICRL